MTGLNEGLARGIGRWDLLAICINTVIGAGIFVLPADAFKNAGSYSLVVFLVAALIVGAIALSYSEVASRFDATGGMYLYAREAFGPMAGFQVGWLYWIVRVASYATNILIFSELLSRLSLLQPYTLGADSGNYRLILVVGISAMIILVNFIGVKVSLILTNIFTVSKLLPLLFVGMVGFFFINPSGFDFGTIPTFSGFTEALVIVLYAYVGFEATLINAGESKDPKRDMPFALIGAMLAISVIFVLLQTVAIGTVPKLAESKAPLSDSAAGFLGSLGMTVSGVDLALIGASVVGVGALVSILGNLNAGFLAGSRIPFAVAASGQAPRLLGEAHPRFKTPWLSILVTGGAVVFLALTLERAVVLKIAVMTRLLVYAVTLASLFVFRKRDKGEGAAFRAPTGGLLAGLSLIVIALLFLDQIFKSWKAFEAGKYLDGMGPVWMIASIAVGAVLFFAFGALGKRRGNS